MKVSKSNEKRLCISTVVVGGGHGTRTLKSVRACPEPVEMKGGISLYSGGCNSKCNRHNLEVLFMPFVN